MKKTEGKSESYTCNYLIMKLKIESNKENLTHSRSSVIIC